MHLSRQRRRPGNRQPQARADLPRDFGWELQQPDEHRGHAKKERRPILVEPLGGLSVFETLGQTQVATAEEPAVQSVRQTVHVKEWQRRKVAVGRRDRPGRDEGETVGRKITLREHRALRRPGRARRVDERHRRIRIGRDRNSRARLRRSLGRQRVHLPDRHIAGNKPGQLARSHHRGGRGVPHDVGQLALSVEHVDRHDDQTELGSRQPKIDDLDPVLQKKREPISRLQTPRAQKVREPIAADLKVAKRIAGQRRGRGLDFERGLGRALQERVVEERQQRHGKLNAETQDGGAGIATGSRFLGNVTPSQRATTAGAAQWPTTFTLVRIGSISASMPSSRPRPSSGRPKL